MSRLSRFQSAALFVGVLYFTFIGGSFYTDFNFPLRLFHQALVTLLLGGWLLGRLWRRQPWPQTPLDGPLAAVLAAAALAATVGIFPRYSWERLWNLLALTLGFYVLVDLKRRGYVAEFVRALYLAAAVVCVVALAEWLCWYLGVPLVPSFAQGWPQAAGLTQLLPPVPYRVGLPLNGPTPLSAYLALLIPPAVALRLTVRRKDDRETLTAWLALAGGVELLTYSRGGLLALAVSLPLLGLGWLAARGAAARLQALWARPAQRRWLAGGAVAALVALAALGAGTLWFYRNYTDRAATVEFRFVLWQAAAKAFGEHPLTGVGPYNFGRALLRRNDPNLPRQQNTTPHNLYLDTAAETGLLGLLAGGWLLMRAALAWRRRWRGAAPPARLLLAGAGAALAGFAAQCLVDTYLAWPVLLPVLAVAAYALVEDASPASVENRATGLTPFWQLDFIRRNVALAALAGLAAYAGVLGIWARAESHFEASVGAAQRGQFPAALAQAQQARTLDPGWPLYIFQAAYLEQLSGQWAAAAADYRAGLALEPVEGAQSANLAGVLWQLGQKAEARAMLTRAAQATESPVYWLNVGYFAEQDGDMSGATAAYAAALARAPEMAASQFWLAAPGRAELWRASVAQAEAQVQPASDYGYAVWRLRLGRAENAGTGLIGEAQTVLALSPGDYLALVTLARAAQQAGKTAEAERWVTAALAAWPGGGEAYWVQGQLSLAQGDEAQAVRAWHKAVFLGELRANYDLGQLALAHGDPAAADAAWRGAFVPHAVSQDVEVTLYNRRATFDVLPPLFRVGVGPEQAAPWLALGAQLAADRHFSAARQIYQILLIEDPYLAEVRQRLQRLPEGP